MLLGNPFENEEATEDPYKTLLVAKLSFETDEERLKREFSSYGQIKKVRVIRDKDGKSRGYAFIEFERRRDFLSKRENVNLTKAHLDKQMVKELTTRGSLLTRRWVGSKKSGGRGGWEVEEEKPENRNFTLTSM